MASEESTARAVLEALHLRKAYGPRGRLRFGRRPGVVALDDVSLTLGGRGTLGIVGESGAGKSTLARCLAGLERPDSGEVRLLGESLTALRRGALRRARRNVQLILQGSAAALNPRFSALDVVTEPLVITGAAPARERRARGLLLMENVGLPRDCADRSCMELSGGQRQRLAIARALALEPKALILDESLSGLDLPVQAQIVNLLLDLQARQPISYVHITHDLRLAAHISDHLAVMQGGRIVESGPVAQVTTHPGHPHSRELLAAVMPLPRGI